MENLYFFMFEIIIDNCIVGMEYQQTTEQNATNGKGWLKQNTIALNQKEIESLKTQKGNIFN